MSAKGKVHHPLFARFYKRFAAAAMAKGEDAYRRRMLGGVSGRVIEVGAGHGLNFPFYPAAVTEVLAVEPESILRQGAEQAAAAAPVPVHVIDGLADQLPAETESFDVGVASLVLCSVDDQRAALAELHRVIRPGGELRFYEHVLAQTSRFARRQHRVDPIWTRFAGGCHIDRDTAAGIEAAGFEIEEIDRFLFSTSMLDKLASPQMLGRARRA
ncbi:MAG: class I SAM-dependent methyltransferase [Actinobacteria bacterium]|nr:class I SAM-dependent methyltransferase [Actinomycetota bacterium]